MYDDPVSKATPNHQEFVQFLDRTIDCFTKREV